MSASGKETVAVLGLGRLGLCFAVVLEQAGYKVMLLVACGRQRPHIASTHFAFALCCFRPETSRPVHATLPILDKETINC